jgi:hypothetical protein
MLAPISRSSGACSYSWMSRFGRDDIRASDIAVARPAMPAPAIRTRSGSPFSVILVELAFDSTGKSIKRYLCRRKVFCCSRAIALSFKHANNAAVTQPRNGDFRRASDSDSRFSKFISRFYKSGSFVDKENRYLVAKLDPAGRPARLGEVYSRPRNLFVLLSLQIAPSAKTTEYVYIAQSCL